jgi:hypothetical protein
MKKKITLALAALGMTAGAISQTAAAQADDAWRFHAIIYGYFPDIGGSSSFPPRQGGSTIDVDSSKNIDSLKFTFMGTFEAQKGRFGFFTDILYLDLGGSKSQTRDLSIGRASLPAGVTANANLDVKGTVWEIAGAYRVVADPAATLDVIAGTRMLEYKQTLGWEFSADLGPNQPSRTGNSEIKTTNWDAIIGVKGRLAFGAQREWFVPYYVDVGTGESDLTWQIFGGLGYAFRWGDVLVGWRYLDYEFKSGSKLEDANLNGPMIGVGFHW